MKIFLGLALFALLSPAARADILFVNFNVATAEIAAVKAAGARLGERVVIYPQVPVSLEKQIDVLYEATQKAEEALGKCRRNGDPCDALWKQYSDSQAALEKLTSQVPTLNAEFFTRLLTEAEQRGETFPTVILSGHSDGRGIFAGTFGLLHVQELEKAFAAAPRLRARVESFLLWGCYSGTLNSLENFWRKNFPQAQLFGGYEDRAPLGIRDVSGIFLKGFLLRQRELLQAHSLREAHALFREIPEVADLEGAAIVKGWYMTYDQADSVDQMMKRCDNFDPKLLNRFTCYNKGERGCENPPASHEGELRELYNFLQKNGHCLPALQEKYQNIPSPEYLIRLIFADNIKKNFAEKYSGYFSNFSRALAHQGFSSAGNLENFATGAHAHSIALQRNLSADPRSISLRDGSLLQERGWPKLFPVLKVYGGVFELLQLTERTKDYCTPFSWVDPGAKEKDFCDFALFLPSDPLSEEGEQANVLEYFLITDETFPIPSIQYIPTGSVAAMKTWIIAFLDANSSRLLEIKNPTDLEKTRLTALKALHAKVVPLPDHDFAAFLLGYVQEHETFVAQLRQKAAGFEHNQKALAALQRWAELDQKLEKALRP